MDPPARCAIDTVDIAPFERWLGEASREDLSRIFSALELEAAGTDASRVAALAAGFAAKEACRRLFAQEPASVRPGPAEFSIALDRSGAVAVIPGDAARATMEAARVRDLSVSITRSAASVSAVALALPSKASAPWMGRFFHRCLPFRRRVIEENLRRVFGPGVPDAEMKRLAQAHYAHLANLASEFVRYRFLSAERRKALARVEGVGEFTKAWEAKRGILVLTGHFGNFEVATAAARSHFPEVHGRIHFVRRPIKPAWLDAWVHRRMRFAGFGTISKRNSLDDVLALLGRGDAIVFPFDQYAGRPEGIESEFFGHPAGTFKSLAIIALATGAPVLPAASWREPDGMHVLRFEPALPLITDPDPDREIRLNTRAYNQALERLVLNHPEQWWWVHRRWKPFNARKRAEVRSRKSEVS